MKFVPFILRNTFRNKRRTILTILSIGMSLFLISTLKTVLDELESPPNTPESAKRVVTRHLTGLGSVMPIAHRARIRSIPGVEEAIASQWFGGIYKDRSNFFAQFALDADRFSAVYPEIHTQTPEQLDNFVKLRTATLVGVDLAKRFDWKVGERITLQGDIFPVDPELTIVGLISGGGSESTLYFHWDYLNELFPAEHRRNLIVKGKETQTIFRRSAKASMRCLRAQTLRRRPKPSRHSC
jgi:putative ABC transport system permease protein